MTEPSAPASSTRRPIAPILILAIALAVTLVTQVVLYDKVLQDDAFVSFIYARNFVRGHGLVFNFGAPPVEGYTNFLWTLLVAAGMSLGWDPIHQVVVMGIITSLGVVALTAALARSVGAPAAVAAGASLLLATKLPFCTEGIGGLETPLFGLLLLAGLLPRMRALPSRRAGLAGSLALGLAALTRPEGILLFVLLEGFDLVGALRGDRRRSLAAYVREAFIRSVPFVIIVGAHLAWRVWTYGDIVPNTAHAKVEPGLATWSRGFGYVGVGVHYFDLFLFLLPYFVFLARRRERPWRLCLFLSTAYCLYIVYVGGDFKPTLRFLTPILPLWCAMGAAAIHWVGGRVDPRRVKAGERAAVALLILLGLVSAARLFEFSQPWLERGKDVKEPAIGRYLSEILPPDGWIAASNVGAIPYYADRRTIDMFGLTDAHIARQGARGDGRKISGHIKGDGAYVLSRAPDVILFMNLDYGTVPLTGFPNWKQIVKERAFGTSEQEIAATPSFYEDYEAVSVKLPGGDYLNYFLRKPTAGR